jgi:hypothetical protein
MSSLDDKTTKIPKLRGATNYEVWALRTSAFLTKEGLIEAITQQPPVILQDINDKALANIQLLVEDGPLLQIQYIRSAKEAWESLKTLYSPQGFTSEFLICRDFFNATLDKYSSMEEYLNKVKQLSDQLKAKQLELPKQVIIAWVLNNLTDNYEGFVSNITQSLRNNTSTFTIETLFSNLLDESKRQDNKEVNHILYTKYKGKKPYKITKGQYCKYCKLASHNAKDCYFLFPQKAPKSWDKKQLNKGNPKDKQHPRDTRDENIDILHSNSLNLSESDTTSPTSSNNPDLINLDFETSSDFDIQIN